MTVSYLRLVHNRIGATDLAHARFDCIQESLLSETEQTVAICAADGLSENVIRSLLEKLRPRLILDFRTAPRFDFGSLTRGKAFDLFDSVGARYLDLGQAFRHGVDDVSAFAEGMAGSTASLGHDAPGASVIAFVDPSNNVERAGLAAIQQLRDRTKLVWELLLFVRSASEESNRKILFISHANPEDNEVAFWLQVQLTRLGYEVWSDMTHLKAGEVFWDSIEDTIRSKAARVLVLVSRKSMQKPGVLDEISLAVSIERTQKIDGFVIPIRVDDLPYSELRANIARKNVIDFSSSWASGLVALNSTLSQDRIPRERQEHGLSLSSWWDAQCPSNLSVVEEREILTSNRFPVVSLPLRLYLFAGVPERELDAGPLPIMPFRGQWLSFLSDVELKSVDVAGLVRQSTFSANEFFSGSIGLTASMPEQARQRLLHGMLNRLWICFLLRRGLKLYAQTSAQPVPYVPDGIIASNTAYFQDESGMQRKRLMVGYSAKRSLYWHVAPAGSFSAAPGIALNLKLRILFSVNGCGEWPTIERMRTARRSFCKNWWNDRWFSLQTAFMSWLSSGSGEVEIHAGEGGRFVLRSTALSYESAVSIREWHSGVEEVGQMNGVGANCVSDDWFDVDADVSNEAEPSEDSP